MASMNIPITRPNSILYGGITNGYYQHRPVPTIHEHLRLLRHRAKLRQEDVADRTGIAQSTLSKWERGGTSPNLQEAARLAELYGVNIDEFVQGPATEGGAGPEESARAPFAPLRQNAIAIAKSLNRHADELRRHADLLSALSREIVSCFATERYKQAIEGSRRPPGATGRGDGHTGRGRDRKSS